MTLHDVGKFFSFNRLSEWQKRAALVISLVVAFNFFVPYAKSGYNFVVNSYKVQKDYQTIQTRLNHLEEYVEVVNYVIDGVGETAYHRGVRYLVTKGKPYTDLRGNFVVDTLGNPVMSYDWYYLVEDEDGIEKWLRAIYSAESDSFSYIDHTGVHHHIKTLEKSKKLK